MSRDMAAYMRERRKKFPMTPEQKEHAYMYQKLRRIRLGDAYDEYQREYRRKNKDRINARRRARRAAKKAAK